MYDKLKRYIGSGLAGGIIAVSLMSLMGPRDGSGNYTLPSGNPVTTGTAISSTWANNTLSDLGTALTNSLAKDGQTTPTANLPMGTFRHTNVGDASARNHYATVNQLQDNEFNTASSVSGTNTITASLAPAITSYSAGMTVVLTPANNNTGATTMALNGLTALDALKYDGDPLVSGDLVAGTPAFFVLDSGGDDWILLNPQVGVDATVRGQYATASQVQDLSLQKLSSVSGTNTITGNLTPAITAYSAGMVITFTPANNNTGATTLAVNGLSALDVLKEDGDALVSGDLRTTAPALLVLDSGADDWILINPQSQTLNNGVAMSDLARLSQTTTFSHAGANALAVDSSDSDRSYVGIRRGGADNAFLCVSSGANPCVSGAAAGQAVVGTGGNDEFAVVTNGTKRIVVAGDGSTINLQATNVQANGTAVSVAGHTHAATDVTSGTLAIARGGTGTTDGTARNITGKAGTTKTLIANASCPPTSAGQDGQIWFCY